MGTKRVSKTLFKSVKSGSVCGYFLETYIIACSFGDIGQISIVGIAKFISSAETLKLVLVLYFSHSTLTLYNVSIIFMGGDMGGHINPITLGQSA